jgi:hypothetical protein
MELGDLAGDGLRAADYEIDGMGAKGGDLLRDSGLRRAQSSRGGDFAFGVEAKPGVPDFRGNANCGVQTH